MPMAGHLRPALPIARRLVAEGHDVFWYTGRKYADLVARTGARVVGVRQGLDFDDAEVDRLTEGGEKHGIAQLRRGIRSVFVEPVPGWVADLDEVIDEVRPDVVVAENGFLAGALAAERRGLPRIVFTVTPLGVSSADTAPFGTGLPPSASAPGRLRNRSLNWAMRRLLFADSQRAAERIRAGLGLPPIDDYFMDWGVTIADRYLCPSIPEFEYPRSDLSPRVEFIGPFLPDAETDEWTPPRWWPDVLDAHAAGRPVVLVTQGTLATDPRNLVLPAVRGLAEHEALVVATTVGFDAGTVLPVAERPANLRPAEFVPFTRLLPMVDVMVTNGGYGGVQLALAHGVPVVASGTTEDKMEVGRRVEWSGAGVSLRTDTPSPRAVAGAVGRVLGSAAYRERARRLAGWYAGYDGVTRATEIVLETASRVPVGSS